MLYNIRTKFFLEYPRMWVLFGQSRAAHLESLFWSESASFVVLQLVESLLLLSLYVD